MAFALTHGGKVSFIQAMQACEDVEKLTQGADLLLVLSAGRALRRLKWKP